jgi:hypothetical protein
MAIDVSWYDEAQTIIRYTFNGPWTWDELNAARETDHALRRTKNYQVDNILDMRRSPIIPQNPIVRFRSFASSVPENAGMTVIVGANTLVEALVNIFRRIYSAPPIQAICFAATLEEAEQRLAQRHQSGSR